MRISSLLRLLETIILAMIKAIEKSSLRIGRFRAESAAVIVIFVVLALKRDLVIALVQVLGLA